MKVCGKEDGKGLCGNDLQKRRRDFFAQGKEEYEKLREEK